MTPQEKRQAVACPKESVMKALIVGITALSLAAGGAAQSKERAAKKQDIGVLSGLAVGAAAAGPIGAILGGAVGGWLGDRWHQTDVERDRLAVELGRSTAEAAAVSKELVASRQQLADADRRNYDLAVAKVVGNGVSGEVLFRTADASLTDSSAARLTEVGRMLATVPGAEVRLEGFADPRGKAADNLTLSEKRALSVRDALVAGGFAPGQVKIEAHGAALSAAAIDDPDGLALERKVVITVGSAAKTVDASTPPAAQLAKSQQ
jgi:outer membrane protein OmpA-like peptidoglycan-associated protein